MSMSKFSKETANATKQLRAEVKKQQARFSIIKHPAVREAFERIPLKMRKNASISVSSFSDTVYIMLSLQGLNSFKDKRFMALLERFLDWNTSTIDFTYNQPNRDVHFEKRIPHACGEFNLIINVMAYVKADSPLCRIVTTGFTEEVVRKEVKEIVCA